MEKALTRKPRKLQLDIIGSGELPPDMALLIRSVLLSRSPETHLITNARSSLQGGAVLVWLMGDTRLIREDARFLFRKCNVEQDTTDGDEAWADREPKEAGVDLDEVIYTQVLKQIDNFLPAKELAGQPLDIEVLRQFGLVDNEKVDQFLASAFAKTKDSIEIDKPVPATKQDQTKIPSAEQTDRNESNV